MEKMKERRSGKRSNDWQLKKKVFVGKGSLSTVTKCTTFLLACMIKLSCVHDKMNISACVGTQDTRDSSAIGSSEQYFTEDGKDSSAVPSPHPVLNALQLKAPQEMTDSIKKSALLLQGVHQTFQAFPMTLYHVFTHARQANCLYLPQTAGATGEQEGRSCSLWSIHTF